MIKKVRHSETFSSHPDNLIHKISWSVRLQGLWQSKRRPPFYDCRCRIFCSGVWKTKNAVLARIVISKYENMLFIVLSSTEVNVVNRNEVFWLCTVEGRAEWAWHPHLSNRREAIYTGTDEDVDILYKCEPFKLCAQSPLRSTAATVHSWTGVCNNTQPMLYVRSVFQYLNRAIRKSSKVID